MLSSRIVRRVGFVRYFSSSGNKDWWDEGDVFGSLSPEEPAVEEPTVKAQDIPRRSSLFTTVLKKREPIIHGTPKMSMSEALYLAKESGIFTTRELQTHFIKSPSFSVDTDSPFLLEGYFTQDLEREQLVRNSPVVPEQSESVVGEVFGDKIEEPVHKCFQSISISPVESFFERDREWLVRGEGRGTRKRATAHVVLQKGSGIVIVNGKEDFYKRWPLLYNRFDVLFPFEKTKSAGLFDVFIAVKGGGISGQAGAARLAIGRALVAVNPQCAVDLHDTLVLTEDTRQKTSKFPGKKGAYARHNWTLR